jgi:hypothetical protein
MDASFDFPLFSNQTTGLRSGGFVFAGYAGRAAGGC